MPPITFFYLKLSVNFAFLFSLVSFFYSNLYLLPAAASEDTSSEPSSLTAQIDDTPQAPEEANTFALDYFGIFYGPSLKNPSAYQPAPTGKPDLNRPLITKNYLTLNYALSEKMSLSGTGYWQWKPVHGQELLMKDPYVRISHNQLLNSNLFFLYADFRIHFPVTFSSRESDLLSALQTFQVLTFQPSDSRFTFGLFSSQRFNWFGSQGYGNDLELYLGPNLSYQISSSVAFTLLYEFGASHVFGDPPGRLFNDGSDLEPGFSWAITPSLVINPYINLFPGDKISLESTSFGMTLGWQLL